MYCAKCRHNSHYTHYQKLTNCRVPESLPCAETRAHGKLDLCRLPEETAHGKGSTHGNNFICRVSAQKTHGKGTTHGKHVRLPCAEKGCTRQTFSTRQRTPACRVPAILHTANLWHTAKLCKKSRHNTPNFFFYAYTVYCTPC